MTAFDEQVRQDYFGFTPCKGSYEQVENAVELSWSQPWPLRTACPECGHVVETDDSDTEAGNYSCIYLPHTIKGERIRG